MAGEDKRGRAVRTRAVVDRVEDGELAVVLVGDEENFSIDLPVSMLPEGAEAGSHLRITVSLDEDSRRAADERVNALQERLEKRGGSQGQKTFKL
jgi:nucleotide-binding universal stress UspA family protein